MLFSSKEELGKIQENELEFDCVENFILYYPEFNIVEVMNKLNSRIANQRVNHKTKKFLNKIMDKKKESCESSRNIF